MRNDSREHTGLRKPQKESCSIQTFLVFDGGVAGQHKAPDEANPGLEEAGFHPFEE